MLENGERGNLILSRRAGEVVVIGTDIEVEVLEIRGDKVRIRVSAPKEVQVHRLEVWEEIQREHEARQNEKAV